MTENTFKLFVYFSNQKLLAILSLKIEGSFSRAKLNNFLVNTWLLFIGLWSWRELIGILIELGNAVDRAQEPV